MRLLATPGRDAAEVVPFRLLCHNHAMKSIRKNGAGTRGARDPAQTSQLQPMVRRGEDRYDADRNAGRHEADRNRGRGSASAIVVFAVLVTIVALIGGAALLLETDPAEMPDTSLSTPTPRPSAERLTDEQAMERFQVLDARRLELFRDPQLAQIGLVFVEGSPAARRVRRSVRELARRGASLRHPVYRTRSLTVESNGEGQIRLEQEVLLRTELVARNGRDLSNDDRAKRQVVEWILKLTRKGWLIADGAVLEAEFTGPHSS